MNKREETGIVAQKCLFIDPPNWSNCIFLLSLIYPNSTTVITRRTFLQQSALAAGAVLASPIVHAATKSKLTLSLAEWSLHRTLEAGTIDHLDFPSIAQKTYGIDVVEYVNGFFGGKTMNFRDAAKSTTYLNELLKRSKDSGVVNHLIMVDEEGFLALPTIQND